MWPLTAVPRYAVPVSSPTLGVWIVTVPTFEPAGQVGSAKSLIVNCASEQPASEPSLLADGDSDTPSGRVIEIRFGADCSLPVVEAGIATLAVNEEAPPALAGLAVNESDGWNSSALQPVMLIADEFVAFVVWAEVKSPLIELPLQTGGLTRKFALLKTSCSRWRSSFSLRMSSGTSLTTSRPKSLRRRIAAWSSSVSIVIGPTTTGTRM